ncbi:chromatin assembly factor 1 subunit A-like [Asterias rubens]|uniref:chromatin assembly factor 1 subunit A-like n=1 Tax=Asterias rubens TaxID=7604 RepID=UPI001454E937|nr:chromatin assembly factor 1 subunit A-like [Asterias rubens]
MIGDYVPNPSDVVGSKKRSLASSPDSEVKSKLSIMSPPSKKLKQARLPFKVLSSPSPNQCHKSPTVDTLPTKKRKHSGSEKSASLILSTKGKTPDVKTTLKKTLESSTKKKVAVSPGTPKRPCIQASDLEPEVTSSCEDQDGGKVASSTTPRRLTTTKPKLLESFLQITQQPQVSTSDDVIEIDDDEVLSTSDVVKDEDADDISEGGSEQPRSNKTLEEESLIDLTLEVSQDSKSASKLGYDADMEDEEDEDLRATPTAVPMEDGTSKTSGESSEAESSTGTLSSAGNLSTPKMIAKTASKTPLSAKALKKEEERRKLREEKIKLRNEKKRKLEEEEAERKRQKMDLKAAKEQEREEARKQKELEKEEKKKEKQLKKEAEDLDREQKKMAKEEEKKKKQDIIDAKMEEKRKKIEEKQQIEDEKLKEEEEKKKKENRQKTFFKSFFKEAAPIKEVVEKSSNWYAPFQVKEHMVLAPLVRNPSFIDTKESFDAAFTDQNCTLLYFEELRTKVRAKGKMGKTPSAKTKEKEATSRTTSPSVEKMGEEKDAQDVEIVSVSPKPKKQTTRMKCKFLQFHENYRPAYYGTWRQQSKMVNPRNYLKKDEDLLDYEIDSDDEWEEPGESLSHSEGEEDGEDDVDAGDSDDGFFVPHGYLSESEGCEGEDEEEGESWKARRAAKAKSWEVELKRQQGVLKAVIVGCLWESASSKASAGNLKAMEAYKIVALTATPIDIRRRKQTTSNDEMPRKDSTLKNVKSIMGVSQGISMKRPVPAEAMPDLIRLVHGNVAGIRTLQREFREFWRLETLKRNSGKPTPGTAVDVPSAFTPTEVSSKSSPGTAEGSPVSTISSASLEGEVDKPSVISAQQTVGAVAVCQSSPNTLIVGTSVMPTPGVTPATLTPSPGVTSTTDITTTTADNIDCSISKRQLLITINAIAVRERRQEHSRTCWYVHNDLLQHYNLQSLPIPSEWQYITKPQKALRAESPLLGHGIPTVNYNHTRINPAGGLPVMMPQSQGMPMHQVYTPSLNSPMTHPHGIPREVQWRLHGNTVRENLASMKSGQVKPAEMPLPHQAMIQPAAGVHVPIHSSVYNCMSPMEIIQKLSQSIPRQPVQQPQPQLFKPVLSNEQVHYMNVLPKQVVSHPTTTTTSQILGSLSLQSQIDQAAMLGQEVKAPHMSPTDIKAMLALQAATERAARSNMIQIPISTPTLPQLAANSAAPAPKILDESTGLSLPQQPTKKTATLKNFFKPSTACTTEKMDTSEDIKDAKQVSVSECPAQTTQADSSEINEVGARVLESKLEEKTKLGCPDTPEEKMSIEVGEVVNKGDVIVIE